MSNTTIGDKIKSFRTRANISQFELEMRLGMSPGCLSRIESGKVNPKKETLLKIVELLELNELESTDLFGLQLGAFPKTLSLMCALARTKDMDDMFSKAVNELAEIMGFIVCSVFVLENDEKGRVLRGQDFA